jgi:hypothetical protein
LSSTSPAREHLLEQVWIDPSWPWKGSFSAGSIVTTAATCRLHRNLSAQEREWIAKRGREARARIRAGRERKAALGEGFGADCEDVAIADAAKAA